MHEKLTLQLFASEDWKVEKKDEISFTTSNSEILLKFNLDQNEFVTYRKEADLTFKVIMFNSVTLFIPHHDELI